MNKVIFRCKFGSHLYGTNTENSDLDYKSVFIPDAQDLILQKAAKHIQKNTKDNDVVKNSKDDIDDESFSVQSFLKLLCEGQTVALDMLFAPDEMVLQTSPEWEFIKNQKEHFLHSGTSAFVGYTRQQAAKYGMKGFRVAALRSILAALELGKDSETIEEFINHNGLSVIRLEPENSLENINIVDVQGKNGPEKHLQVCNRKVPFNAKVKYAKEVYQRIFDMYGERALKAEKNEGIDWKALSHAARVAGEATELLETKKITFPRPDRRLLLQIKQGELPYKEVAEIIESGLIKVVEAQKNSKLRSTPNWEKAEKIVHDFHLNEIKQDYVLVDWNE